ncbi:LOW QUALITY PROTEIN: uncharacterized protein Dyak_GE28770 [Drosophila yakuba]|uniref:Uncharacterized protein n=1 Tax=Drosophila yakuba TaxID=7245 RepID=A0A0R1DT37_DROYA|nr:LOW QUALITY PROTEIN: uncharacterized protein Dyak_GE28770 [Drosophila yakuba]
MGHHQEWSYQSLDTLMHMDSSGLSTNPLAQRSKPYRGYGKGIERKTFKRTLDKFAIWRNGTETEGRSDLLPARYTSKLFADSTSPAAADSDSRFLIPQSPFPILHSERGRCSRRRRRRSPHTAQLYDIDNRVIVDCIHRVAATNGDGMSITSCSVCMNLNLVQRSEPRQRRSRGWRAKGHVTFDGHRSLLPQFSKNEFALWTLK